MASKYHPVYDRALSWRKMESATKAKWRRRNVCSVEIFP
jgi:hypothetical protein